MDTSLQTDNSHHSSMTESKDMCRQLLDTVPAALCVANSNGIILAANIELGNVFPNCFVKGRSFFDFVNKTQQKAVELKFDEVVQQKAPYACFSAQILSTDGKEFAADCRISILTCGNETMVVCRFSDRSIDVQLQNALLRAYSRLQLLTEGIHDLILELSAQGLIVFANKDFNGRSRSELHNLSITEILPLNIHKQWNKAFTEQKNSEFKFKIRGQDGYLHYISHLTFINQGDVFAVYTINDETESFLKTDELLESKKMLQQTIESKDRFLSIIAHDLKAPFNALISFGQLLSDTINEGRYQRAERLINLINESSINSYNLLENLLTWSRSQQNHLTLSPTSFYVAEAIIDTFDMLKAVTISKKIQLIYENDVPQTIYADYNMIKTVLRNLISNAIKFSFEGGSIWSGYRLQNGAIQIYVRDEGTGIPDEVRKILFTQLKPSSHPGTRNEKGTGLGLLVCKEFVSLHGGKIEVVSEEGKGSEFCFTIPAAIRTGPNNVLIEL